MIGCGSRSDRRLPTAAAALERIRDALTLACALALLSCGGGGGSIVDVGGGGGGGGGGATPAGLRFLTQPPASLSAGQTFSVAVEIISASGARVTTATTTVTVALAPNVSSATLSGTTSVAAVAGVATFTNLSVSGVTTAFSGTITATAAGLPAATSTAINIAVGAPVISAVTTTPTTAGTTSQPVTITGSGFQSGLSVVVTLAASTATYSGTLITSTSATSIVLPIVLRTAGSWQFQVRNPDGQSSNTATLNVSAAAACTATFPTMPFPGTQSGTIASTDCIQSAAYQDRYSLTTTGVTGGGYFRLTIAPTGFIGGVFVATPSIVNGENFSIGVGSTAGATVTRRFAAPLGSYVAGAAAISQSSSTPPGTGPYTFTVAADNPNSGCENITIPVGLTATSLTIATVDCTYSTTRPGTTGNITAYYDQYVMFSPLSCTITMRATNTTFDPYLELYSTAGTKLQDDDDSGGGLGGLDARLVLSPCKAGTGVALIRASTYDAFSTGTYTLEVTMGTQMAVARLDAAARIAAPEPFLRAPGYELPIGAVPVRR
jgi:hypothetical protein